MNLTIRRLAPNLAADYFDFFDNRAFTDDSPFRCYCQVYQISKEQAKRYEKEEMYASDPRRFARIVAEEQIHTGALRGYLAYADGVAIGWCNANDKSNFPKESRDGESFYAPAEQREMAVVCFEIAPAYRGRGVATALLRRVVEDAKADGCLAVEGFPVIRQERFKWDCQGPVRLFEKLGFARVSESDGRAVMRKELG